MIKVLIVEDDPMVAELNRRYLEQVEGFILVAVVRSVDEALKIMDGHHIDLILLDIFMPGMNGLELLAYIRKAGKGIDAILVTAACDRHNINEALRYGAVDYLIKPFEFERFNAALAAYRKRSVCIKDQSAMTQAELDERILWREYPEQDKLPKGLDRNTLKKVCEYIQSLNGTSFTTKYLADSMGISRVSMRKYLDFLEQIKVLDMEVTYGSVGRPVFKYHCINMNSDLINRL
ncbi:MAG: dcuR [Firmicutes bacterium]|nr:dcuR [Bacillota bacterium]